MARGDQLARQWRIIQTLVSSATGKSAAELTRNLGCNARTVYRDLEALQVAGFPIYTERVEGKHLWSLLDTVKHHLPIPFSLTELMALYFSLNMAKAFQGTIFYDPLESLFQKISTTLPQESITFLKNAEQTLTAGNRPYTEYRKFKEIINQVTDATFKKKTIEIVYFTMSRKRESRRKVDPYRIWLFHGTFYLIGYCHLRKEVRIFSLDRIKMLHITPEKFALPAEFDLNEFMRLSLGIFQGDLTKIRVRFDSAIAGYIKEKVWHESQVLLPQEDGSIILEAEVAGTEDAKHWIMTWGAKAEVLEPVSLRNEMFSEAAALLKRYDKKEGRKKDQHRSDLI